MTVEEFAASEGNEFSGALLVLWWDAKGNWEKAHEVAQDVAGPDADLGACLSASEGWGFGECGLLVSAGGTACWGGRFAFGVGGHYEGDARAVNAVVQADVDKQISPLRCSR